MSIVLASPLIAILLAPLAGFVASRVGRLFSSRVASRRIGRWVGLMSFAVFLVGLPYWMSRPSVYIDMPSAEGERLLRHVGLPSGTTEDFCYRFSLVGVTVLADFTISEPEFLRWMGSQGWTASRFHTDGTDGFVACAVEGGGKHYVDVSVSPVRTYDAGVELVPKEGYVFFTSHPDHADNTTTIIYDLEAGRAYYRATTY